MSSISSSEYRSAPRIKWHSCRFLPFVLLLMAMSGQAWASLTCPVSNGTWTISMPASIVVPRNAKVGTLLTPWRENDAGRVTQFWANCNYTGGGNYGRTGSQFYWSGGAASGTRVTGNSNISVLVYNSNVAGIGIAVQVIGYSQNCGSGEWGGGWRSMDAPGPNSPAPGWVCTPTKHGYWQGGGRAAFALVKTGEVKPGRVSFNKPLRASLFYDEVQNYGGSNFYWYFDVTSTDVTVAGCSTPDVSVSLGNVLQSDLPSIGSRSSPTKFDLNVEGCPAGLNGVDYSFNASSGTSSVKSQGLIGLNASATAKGVQVKLMQGDGATTVELDKFYPLTAYNSAAGGSYVVPLSAAYERTGDVQPGTASAELVIAMQYK